MFGTGDCCDYLQCGQCGCLQIAAVPANLDDYYPPEYYSFGSPRRENMFRRYLQRQRASHTLNGGNIIGKLMVAKYGVPETLEHMKRAGISREDSVLEIGSGSGDRLLALNDYGFTNLTGIDPYIKRSVELGDGVRLLKRELAGLETTFTFVMLHHAFEHMDQPASVMADIHRVLIPGGRALIRIPLALSLAHKNYGVSWVQLDAPRHLYLHTRASMEQLAKSAGLIVEDVVFDSTAFQFWGSEQYKRGIPLRDRRSYAMDPAGSVFSSAEIESFEREANRVNRTGEGDQACFYLRKPST